MMDINEVITELNNIKKGDIIFMKKHDYISGNCEKVRPHIIIDIILVFWVKLQYIKNDNNMIIYIIQFSIFLIILLIS